MLVLSIFIFIRQRRLVFFSMVILHFIIHLTILLLSQITESSLHPLPSPIFYSFTIFRCSSTREVELQDQTTVWARPLPNKYFSFLFHLRFIFLARVLPSVFACLQFWHSLIQYSLVLLHAFTSWLNLFYTSTRCNNYYLFGKTNLNLES